MKPLRDQIATIISPRGRFDRAKSLAKADQIIELLEGSKETMAIRFVPIMQSTDERGRVMLTIQAITPLEEWEVHVHGQITLHFENYALFAKTGWKVWTGEPREIKGALEIGQ